LELSNAIKRNKFTLNLNGLKSDVAADVNFQEDTGWNLTY